MQRRWPSHGNTAKLLITATPVIAATTLAVFTHHVDEQQVRLARLRSHSKLDRELDNTASQDGAAMLREGSLVRGMRQRYCR